MYVVAFQWLQNKLVQLASFAQAPERAGHGQDDVARLTFRQLIDKTQENVDRFLDEWGGEEPELLKRTALGSLPALLDRCREIASHRNSIVHSTYLHLEAGGELAAIVRHDARAEDDEGNYVDDHEPLQEGSFDQAMEEIGDVGLRIGFCHTSLIGLYRP